MAAGVREVLRVQAAPGEGVVPRDRDTAALRVEREGDHRLHARPDDALLHRHRLERLALRVRTAQLVRDLGRFVREAAGATRGAHAYGLRHGARLRRSSTVYSDIQHRCITCIGYVHV